MPYTGTKSQSGRGSIFSIGPVTGTASPTYVKVGEVKKASPSGSQWETADATNFDSGIGKEFITTIFEGGEVDIDFNRVSADAGQQALEAARIAGASYMFTIALPKTAAQVTTGDTLSFNALVLSNNPTIGATSIVENTAKLKVSGLATWAYGS